MISCSPCCLSRHVALFRIFSLLSEIPNHERIKLPSPPCQVRCYTSRRSHTLAEEMRNWAKFELQKTVMYCSLADIRGWWLYVDRKNCTKFTDIVNGLCESAAREISEFWIVWERLTRGWQMDDEKCVTQGSLSQARRRPVFTGVQSSSLGLATLEELLDLFFSIHFYAFDCISLFSWYFLFSFSAISFLSF